ncbi:MAG TPA: GNAT family N-acetyltransferase [Actinomycetes bacterium]|nr:GNAT family N-acetyltransferase [Actinomycetes bacterium]
MTGPPPPPPGPAVTVRDATPADVDALVAMLVEVAGEGRWIGVEAPVDVDRRRQRMAADVEAEDAIVLVAEAGGEPVGQLGLRLAPYGVADLGMLVAAGWRGRGVGAALLAEAVRRARQAGAHKIALQVWPHNAAAIALYERFGFQREGYLRRHYRRRSGELWDAVMMGLPLD